MHKSGFFRSVMRVVGKTVFPGKCGICKNNTENGICDMCDAALDVAMLSEPAFDIKYADQEVKCAVSFLYNDRDAVEMLMFELKRNNSFSLIDYCAKRALFAVSHLEADGKAVYTEIPRSKDGLRKNGFDQAKLIAKRAAEISADGEYVPILKRTGISSEQKRLRMKERADNVKGKFCVRTFCPLPPEYNGSIIVFDDVCTTGSSFSSCYETLKRSFPKAKVYGAFLARTQDKKINYPKGI